MTQALDGVNSPIELGGITINATGNLARRQPKLPLVFQFKWREISFNGEVVRVGEELVLKISADVVTIPFSAEDGNRRQPLLSFLQTGAKDNEQAALALSPGNVLSLRRQIELPREGGLTAGLLVSETAKSVLLSAPYLDLMADGGAAPRPIP